MACPKTGTIETNIKMTLTIVMERDSLNPTPTIDTEPKNSEILDSSICSRRDLNPYERNAH